MGKPLRSGIWLTLIGITVGSGVVEAQETGNGREMEPIRVVPGNGVMDLSRLEPFEATYDQLGHRFSVRLSRGGENSTTWSFSMEMDSPRGAIIDHVGHSAVDLAMKYRRFSLGAFGDEYLEVSVDGEVMSTTRFDREAGPSAELRSATQSLSDAVVDGTFLYWTLGLLPLRPGGVYRYSTWAPGETGMVIRDSAPLRIIGQESVRLPAGPVIDTWVFEVDSGGGLIRMFVTPAPPFLVRQEVVDEAGNVTPLIELRRSRPTSSSSDRAQIEAAGRAFSAAYVAGDTARIRTLYTPDAVLLPPGGLIQGRDAIARYFAPNPRRSVVAHSMISDSLEINGDEAIDIGTWSQTSRPGGGGEPVTASERYLIVWRRGADGTWRISHDMWHRPPS